MPTLIYKMGNSERRKVFRDQQAADKWVARMATNYNATVVRTEPTLAETIAALKTALEQADARTTEHLNRVADTIEAVAESMTPAERKAIADELRNRNVE